MNNLTEQYKNGELDEGWYQCKDRFGIYNAYYGKKGYKKPDFYDGASMARITQPQRPTCNMLYSENYEMYFVDMEEYLDYCEDNEDEPEDKLEVCDYTNLQLDSDANEILDVLIERMADDDNVEEWDIQDYESRLEGLPELKAEIKASIEKFNAKQPYKMYKPNGKMVTVLAHQALNQIKNVDV